MKPLFEPQLKEAGLKQITGPLPGSVAWKSEDEPVSLRADLGEDIAPRGSLSFWVRLEEPFRSGPEAGEGSIPLLSSPGLFDYNLAWRPQFFGFMWRWRNIEGDDAPSSFRVLLPGVPGPFWVHVAMEWDREQGIFNGYLNGTPARLPGVTVPSWTTPESSELVLEVGQSAVSDVRFSTDLLDREQLREEVTPLYWRTLDGLMGAYDPAESGIEPYKGELIQEWSLSDPGQVEDWVMEGPGIITFEDGWMQMDSERPDGPEGHVVFWPPQDWPGDFIAEWEFQLLRPEGLAIVFFSAKGREGEDIFDPALEKREGIFPRYHSGDIDCYHISYYANTPNEPGRITSNLRKNHGFYLVTNGPAGIAPGSTEVHTVQLMKQGNRIKLAVDGKTIIDFIDDGQTYGPVLGEGKLGLRQMQWSKAQYRHLRIYSIR